VLIDALSWNWIFYVNIVPGIISALLCASLLPDPHRQGRASLDGVGLALMAMGLGCLQYVLDDGERYGWFGHQNITITAIVAIASLASFVYWELRVVKNPIVDIRILITNGARADTQKATSLLSLFQQLGGSISTAVLVTLLDRRGAFHQDHLASSRSYLRRWFCSYGRPERSARCRATRSRWSEASGRAVTRADSFMRATSQR